MIEETKKERNKKYIDMCLPLVSLIIGVLWFIYSIEYNIIYGMVSFFSGAFWCLFMCISFKKRLLDKSKLKIEENKCLK